MKRKEIKDRVITPEETELVRAYVMDRPLNRPEITLFKFLICMLTTVLIALTCNFFLSVLISKFTSFSQIAIYVAMGIIEVIISSKKFCISVIHLYQHYAPEEVRRRCLLKPTCSEYSILVIKKYGVLIGLFKTWIRLVKRCKGDIYYIDEP